MIITQSIYKRFMIFGSTSKIEALVKWNEVRLQANNQ